MTGGRAVSSHEGFRQFVLERGPALSRTAFLLTGDHAEAEDLLQEALITAAARWDRITASGDPEPWVRTVMLNQLRTWRRPRRLRFVTTEVLSEPPAVASESDRTDAKLALLRALALLGPRQRLVLYLRYYEDRSETEIARQLGCSTGTVKRHTHDALQRLRAVAPQLLSASDPTEVRS